MELFGLILPGHIRKHVGRVVRRVIPYRMPMKGPFGSFEAALAEATGYDSPLVTKQVEEATKTVIEGRAAYERDGTAFQEIPELWIHKVLRGVLNPDSTIADFGGGLGGLFISGNGLFPQGCRRLVIEQSSMVATGKRLASAYGLRIEFIDAADLSDLPSVDVLILSSVLQYLVDPWTTLETLINSTRPTVVILDRTAIHRGPSRWYLQTNPGYYCEPVTYPIQVLERRRLIGAFKGYRPAYQWHNEFDAGRPEHIGMLLKKVEISEFKR